MQKTLVSGELDIRKIRKRIGLSIIGIIYGLHTAPTHRREGIIPEIRI